MVKIIMQVSKMKEFLEVISCEGQTDEDNKQDKVIKEFVVFATDSFIESYATDKVGKLFADIKFSANVIEPGQFTIGNVNTFEKFLNLFQGKDEITISQENGIIRFERQSPRKLARFITVSIDNIETFKTAELIHKRWKFNDDKTELGTDKTKLKNVIVAKAEDFAQIIDDSSAVGEQHYPFVIMKDPFANTGNMILKVDVGSLETSMSDVKSIIPAVINSVEINNSYAYGFDNVFKTLKGEVRLFTAPNMPLWVTKEAPNFSARYMLTPVID